MVPALGRVEGVRAAREVLESTLVDLVITDMKLGATQSGMDVLRAAANQRGWG